LKTLQVKLVLLLTPGTQQTIRIPVEIRFWDMGTSFRLRRCFLVICDKMFEMEIEEMFSKLMGEKVEPRREFIERHAKEAMNVDWHY
jgi:hypothetical protein